MKNIVLVIVLLTVAGAAYVSGRMQAGKVVETPPASWTEGSDAAEAWRELNVSLEAAGARVFAAVDDAGERREGLQYLADLLSVALEMYVSKGDAARPRFTDWMADYRKLLGDTPDAVYHTAPLASDYRYEITGNTGGADYLGFMLYGSGLNGWNRAAANLSQDQMAIDDKGDFRIVLSSDKPATEGVDWLALEDDIHMVMVRQYFHDRPGSEEATLRIRNLDPVESAPAERAPAKHSAPDEAAVAAGLRAATGFFNATLDGTVALAGMLSERPNDPRPPRAYNQDLAGVFYPTFDNEYLGAWFKIGQDEALIVEGEVPDAPYWSVSLQNRWLQSLDYRQHTVSLNDATIVTRDGRYRIIVSHRRPDSDNWLDAAGHTEGLLAIRHQLPRSESTLPTLTLVKFDDLPASDAGGGPVPAAASGR